MSKALYSVLFRPVGCVHSGKGRKAEKPKVTQPADSDEEGPLLLGKSREGLEDRHLTDISRLLSGLLQNRGLWEGRGGGFPFDPRAPKVLSARPRENPSRIPVHSSLGPG